MVTDSYQVSNEALWRQRPVSYLRWLAGRQTRMIFDETHLGPDALSVTSEQLSKPGPVCRNIFERQ